MQQQSNKSSKLQEGTWSKGNPRSFTPSQSKWRFGLLLCLTWPVPQIPVPFVVQRKAVPSSCLGSQSSTSSWNSAHSATGTELDSSTGWTQWEKYGEWCGEVDSNCQTSFHFSTVFGMTVLFSIVAFQFEEEFIETKEDLEKLRSGESVNCSLNIDSNIYNKRTTGDIFLKTCNMMWPVCLCMLSSLRMGNVLVSYQVSSLFSV